MGEVLRRVKRTWMLEATSIFLTFDDKAGRKLLRFKCDTPACSDAKGKDGDTPMCFDAKGKDEPTMRPYGARIGIVGCMPMRVGSELSHYEEDYAERTKDDIVALLRRMLTPAGESCDDASTLEVFQKVRGVCVDGQLLKTAQAMQQGVPEHRHHHAGSCAYHPDFVSRPSARCRHLLRAVWGSCSPADTPC